MNVGKTHIVGLVGYLSALTHKVVHLVELNQQLNKGIATSKAINALLYLDTLLHPSAITSCLEQATLAAALLANDNVDILQTDVCRADRAEMANSQLTLSCIYVLFHHIHSLHLSRCKGTK